MENTVRQTEPKPEETNGAESGSTQKKLGKVREALGLTQKKMDDYLRFFIFLVAIGLVYVWNSHLAEKQVIKEDKLKTEIRDLRLHYISLESELSEQKKPSVVADSVKARGLNLLTVAPYQLEKESE